MDLGNSSQELNQSQLVGLTTEIYSSSVVIPLAIFLVFVIILTILGNSMVIMTIIRHKRMRTRTNMFITNLAVSDILTAVFDMPVSLVTLMEGRWIFGEIMCHVNGFTMVLFLITSIHTLMYISVHKCISITRPFSRFMTQRRILYMIFASWLWAFVYAFAAILGWNRSIFKPGATQCGPSYPDDAIKKSHSIVNTTFNFFVPLVILSVCYFRTFREIRAHMDRMRETTNIDVGNQNTTVIQQKRIAVTLFMVMACFLFCLTPYVVYSCLAAFSKNKDKLPVVLNPVAYWCIYANCACNPIIYAFRSPAFRQGYKEIMCGRTMHYLSAGSFRSTSQRSWSYRSSVKSTSISKDRVIQSSRRGSSTRRTSSQTKQVGTHNHSNGSARAIKNVVNVSSAAVVPNICQIKNEEPPSPDKDVTKNEECSLIIIPNENENAGKSLPEKEKSAKVEEEQDTFYDSDVEMEHNLRGRRRRIRRRRQSQSMVISKRDQASTVSHLIQAQARLMNIQSYTSSPFQRPRSLSDLCSGDQSLPTSGDCLDIPRVYTTHSAGNLLDIGTPLSKKLTSSFKFFGRSKEKSIEKMSISKESF